MSTEIQRASADAVQAAVEADRYAEILAVVAAVQAVQAAPQHNGCGCAPAKPRRSAGEVAALAAGVCACVGVATAALLAVALAAVGVAVSALVCWLIIREIRKGK